jgi:hypothetical protein
VAFIAAVWNITVSATIGWPFIDRWNKGFGAWFPELILSPFHVIGILLLIAVVYYSLAVYNPRPKLTIHPGQVRMGEAFDLEWEFFGSTRSVKRLHIFLEGGEEVKVGSGKSRSTYRSVFARLTVAEMHELEIRTRDDKTGFLPGEELSGEAVWRLDSPPASVELRLFWYTDGRARREVNIVERISFDNPMQHDHRNFLFRLPDMPYSFSGKYVSVLWALELEVPSSGRTERLDIVMSPTGSEIAPYGQPRRE